MPLSSAVSRTFPCLTAGGWSAAGPAAANAFGREKVRGLTSAVALGRPFRLGTAAAEGAVGGGCWGRVTAARAAVEFVGDLNSVHWSGLVFPSRRLGVDSSSALSSVPTTTTTTTTIVTIIIIIIIARGRPSTNLLMTTMMMIDDGDVDASNLSIFCHASIIRIISSIIIIIMTIMIVVVDDDYGDDDNDDDGDDYADCDVDADEVDDEFKFYRLGSSRDNCFV